MRMTIIAFGAATAIGLLFYAFAAPVRMDAPLSPGPKLREHPDLRLAQANPVPPARPEAQSAEPITAVSKTTRAEEPATETPPQPQITAVPATESVASPQPLTQPVEQPGTAQSSGPLSQMAALPQQPATPSDAPAAAALPKEAAAPPASPAPAPPAITPKSPAKDLFAAAREPANMATRSIGFYAKGCLAGAQPLPVNGAAWQVMKLSRNRFWGHPSLIKFIERFATDMKEKEGWPGLLIGDMSMPRGGPMPNGHVSHQVGLDVDIWYRPMPDHVLSAEEREEDMQSFLLDAGHVDPQKWTPDYEKLLRRAVSYPEVARIFVNPAIKKWLCETVKTDRAFLSKINAIPGHHDHFHVRLVCPPGEKACVSQSGPPAGDGCGKGLDKMIEVLSRPAPPASAVPAKPAKPKPPMTLAELPADCQNVLKAAPIVVSTPVATSSH